MSQDTVQENKAVQRNNGVEDYQLVHGSKTTWSRIKLGTIKLRKIKLSTIKKVDYD